MKKIFLLLVMVSGMAFAQNSNQLRIGIGQVNHQSLVEGLSSEAEPVVSVGVQFDAFTKSNFVLGPEVSAFTERSLSSYLPGVTFGGLTGYDNGNFRLVAGLGAISTNEAARHVNPDIKVFRGIFASEIGYGPIYARGEWYTNLKTYFYSYTVQVGFRIKL